MTGTRPPATVDGMDLGPIVRGEKADVREATLHAYRSVQRAVRTHADLLKTMRERLENLSKEYAATRLKAEPRNSKEHVSKEGGPKQNAEASESNQ